MGQSWSRCQAKQNARSLLELAPKKTPGQSSPLPDLDAAVLNEALKTVAAYIHKRKKNVTIIAVGGAVNTIFLHSRRATHDVDFFNNNLSAGEYSLLIAGAKEACKVVKAPKLQEDWFNNHTIFFIPQEHRSALTQEAIAQNQAIFKQPGLTVLAAPWYYAFCCKIDRIAGSGVTAARPYDLSDAVAYIKRHMATKRVTSVTKAEIHTWFGRFGLRWNPNVEAALERVKAAGVPIN